MFWLGNSVLGCFFPLVLLLGIYFLIVQKLFRPFLHSLTQSNVATYIHHVYLSNSRLFYDYALFEHSLRAILWPVSVHLAQAHDIYVLFGKPKVEILIV